MLWIGQNPNVLISRFFFAWHSWDEWVTEDRVKSRKVEREVKIEIPEELKQWLVIDWDAINRKHELAQVPAITTVNDIINAYNQKKRSNKCKFLVKLFNDMLEPHLLYDSEPERRQYNDIVKEHPGWPMAYLYGSTHLLRSFHRLGVVLAKSGLSDSDINIIKQHAHEFLEYLLENIDIYFSKELFVSVTSEYAPKAQ